MVGLSESLKEPAAEILRGMTVVNLHAAANVCLKRLMPSKQFFLHWFIHNIGQKEFTTCFKFDIYGMWFFQSSVVAALARFAAFRMTITFRCKM